MVRLLSDRGLAERLGAEGRARSTAWTYTAEEYADDVATSSSAPSPPGLREAVVVTQEVDPASPVLGATVAKIEALAARVDEVVVLADRAVDGALPDNCRVRLFRASHRAGRGLRFESALARELARGPRPAVVLAHMCPIYAVLAAPVARPLGVGVLLWFTHWRRSRLLATAERASTVVVTVEQRTFPLSSRKVVAIGHGIDVSDLPCVERPPRDELTLLALGRTSPAKGLETIIRAVAVVPGAELDVVGPSLTDEERLHRIALERLVIDLGLRDRVDIRPPVPRHTVPGLLGEVDALVNNMRAGATDKVVYEAAATCMPVLASNPAFDSFCRRSCVSRPGDPDGLALAIVGLLRRRSQRRRSVAPRDRGPRALGGDLGGPRRRARAVSGTVLHVVKVAGISGAENHLLLLLPALREHGFDVRCVMLHEDEPGAEEFASRLVADGVPVDRVRIGGHRRPGTLVRLTRIVRRERPDILHTHLVHADFHGLVAARLARVPVLVSTKHGFNPFRERRLFAVADRTVARLADLHIAISAGSRGTSRTARGSSGELRDRPLRHRAGTGAGAASGCAAARDRRPADPDQGPRRAPARDRSRRGDVPGLALEVAGDGAARRRAARDGLTARPRRRRPFLGQVPGAPVYERA